MQPYNLSQNALAKAIHVSPGRINEIINGTRKITADTDLRLCKLFGFKDGFFLRIQEQYDLAQARKLLHNELPKIEPIKPPQSLSIS